MNPWDFSYVISGWMLVALVILPFLFGLLYGMRVAHKRFIVKLVKEMDSDKLKTFITGENKENTDKNAN